MRNLKFQRLLTKINKYNTILNLMRKISKQETTSTLEETQKNVFECGVALESICLLFISSIFKAHLFAESCI